MILQTVRLDSFRLVAVLALLIVATAACGPFGGSKAAISASPPAAPTQTPRSITQGTPIPVGPAPAAATVDTASLGMIDRWRQYQVPLYPGATEVQFSQLGKTVVQNGGTTLYTTPDAPDKVLAYYLGAMPMYGWTMLNANSRQAAFKSDKASLSISVTADNGVTTIMMILGDV